MLPAYGKSLKNIVADAGYESEENYTYLETNNLAAYIKPSNYETKKKRITKQNIGRRENMLYLEDQDAYVCKAGKYLARGKDRKTKTASGYVDTVWTYTCRECGGCPHASECIRTRNSVSPTHKSIQFSPSFEQHRMQSEANIMSDVGINHRINRSIQAEGAFSKLKDGLGYTRFRHRSIKRWSRTSFWSLWASISINCIARFCTIRQRSSHTKKQLRPDADIAGARLICHALKMIRPNGVLLIGIS